MLWYQVEFLSEDGMGVKGEKGEGDNGEGEALLVLRWLLSLPQLSSPLSPSFNCKSKNGYSRQREKREWGGAKNNFHISHCNINQSEHQANTDSFKQCPTTEK